MDTTSFARVERVARTGSTSTDLVGAAAAAPEAWPHLSALLADHQDAGRGRSGRAWETPPGAALTASILLRPLVAPDQLGWITLLAGLAVARAVGGCRHLGVLGRPAPLGDGAAGAPGRAGERIAPTGPGLAAPSTTGPAVALKWPNDVLVRDAGPPLDGWGTDRKVAGVLTEVVPVAPAAGTGAGRNENGGAQDSADRAGRTAVVVGIGVNLTQAQADLPVPWATSLALAGLPVAEPMDLLGRIGAELAAILRAWEGEGGVAPPAAVRSAVHEACASIGQEVRVDLPGGGTVTGTGTDLDDHGHLLVATAAGEVAVLAGDVVHLRGATAGPPV
ncbi:biotin--[acetyl-CoA-carboxylase] ligase [Georgenia sp. MJ206]|uniref:biotin--[acetyl-CoA-carboxylase] ligase n=1 Tax=Georgenia wangjunii TaxID=3117730 RepID=UPI002F26D17F